MPIELRLKYRRADIQRERDKHFVFGDNWARKGRGGQAAECRGEPNTIGITTKKYPSMELSALLTDADIDTNNRMNVLAWQIIEQLLDEGKTVVWPVKGIGTGLSKLDESAPKIFADINDRFEALLNKYETV